MREHKKAYLISTAVGLLIALGVFLVKGLFTQTDALIRLKILCDGFFVSAVMLLGVGLLVMVSNEGIFSTLAFGVKRFGLFFFNRKIEKDRESYADYYQRKREKQAPYKFLLVVGGAFMLVAVILCVVYITRM